MKVFHDLAEQNIGRLPAAIGELRVTHFSEVPDRIAMQRPLCRPLSQAETAGDRRSPPRVGTGLVEVRFQALTRWVALLLLTGLATPALADGLPPLRDDPHVVTSLVAARVGDTVRKNCPTISARIIVAYLKLRQLQSYTVAAGYGADEVKAFIKDPAEKARIAGMAKDYMAKNGVMEGDSASYCTLGRSEIAHESLIGSLLRDDG